MALLEQEIAQKKQRALKLLEQNRLPDAKKLYQKILKKVPADADAWFMLGTVEGRMGDLSGAEKAMCKALGVNPELPEAWLGLGQVLELCGKEEEACKTYLKALSNNPNLVEAYVSLGRIYASKQLFDEAIHHLGLAVQLGVDRPQVLLSYGDALNKRGRFKEAFAIFKGLQQQFPNDINLLYRLAMLYSEFSEMDQAQVCFEKMLEIDSNNLYAKLGCVTVLRHKKEYDKALQQAELLFESEKQNIPVAVLYSKLCHLNDSCDKAIARFETLLKDPQISPAGVELISFPLGRLYDKKGDYDKAFAAYKQGNDLKWSRPDHAMLEAMTSAIIRGYSREVMSKCHAAVSRERPVPVFVVGMPRSGTTLVEQILGSHPDVHGVGELTDLIDLEREYRGTNPSLEQLGHEAENFTRHQLDDMAERYLDHLAELSDGERYVIDKLPGNFFRLGLIVMLFPNAKIIHCKRNPLDTCLSCYFQDFSGFNPFVYNLDDLVCNYKNYQRLMQHWCESMPLPMLDICYEDVVKDQEKETRRMLEYLGLEWDDACLQFYKNKRVVVTASQSQVNKPIYQSSVSRWKNYEKHIGTLIEGLA